LQHPGAFPPDLEAYVIRSTELAEQRALSEQRRVEIEASRARWITRASVLIAVIFTALSGFIYLFYEKAVSSEVATKQYASAAAYATALQQTNFDEAKLAYLAQAARLNPQNVDIGVGILMLLANRYWSSLAMPDLQHDDIAYSADFTQMALRS
jgi:hypothetical protein